MGLETSAGQLEEPGAAKLALSAHLVERPFMKETGPDSRVLVRFCALLRDYQPVYFTSAGKLPQRRQNPAKGSREAFWAQRLRLPSNRTLEYHIVPTGPSFSALVHRVSVTVRRDIA